MPKKSTRAVKIPRPGWDLYVDGISYSLLSKFVDCRERFRISTVELLAPSHQKDSLDFGTMFHKALELYAAGNNPFKIVQSLMKRYKNTNIDPILIRIVAVMVPIYIDFYKTEKVKYVGQEEVFDVPYVCKSNGRIIRLRGRWDELFEYKGKLWLQENKTKTTIQDNTILSTLPYDLQTMLYCSTLQKTKKRKVGGVLYNVIRRPLLKQGAKESDSEYLTRIVEHIREDPGHYFKRFRNEFIGDEIAKFEERTLNPLLESVANWWESIKKNPFDPWFLDEERKIPNPNHYTRPFGVYSPLAFGIGDYFDYVTNGSKAGLITKESCFPELEGEQGCVSKIEKSPSKKKESPLKRKSRTKKDAV